MRYDFVIVDVFTDAQFGGNQLAVIPAATGLTPTQMQQIAREFNFAETTFVLPPHESANTARLRIFSPMAEMPFAGHPTVGTAAVLVQGGHAASAGAATLVLEEAVGPVQVSVRDDADAVYSELALDPELQRPDGAPGDAALAAALSLPREAVRDTWFAGVGLPFCFCRLASEAHVDGAVLAKAAWSTALGQAWARHLFVFAGELADGGELYARMFAPAIGIDEDPATGSAAAALVGCLAADGDPDAQTSITIRQGFAMGRPSIISAGARMEAGRLRKVTVGGHVVQFATGTLQLPEGVV